MVFRVEYAEFDGFLALRIEADRFFKLKIIGGRDFGVLDN